MSTAIDYQTPIPFQVRSRHRHGTQLSTTDSNTDASIELTDLNSPPPAYTQYADSNPETHHHHHLLPIQTPTLHLQIETTGKPILSLPLPPHPDPIPVYLVDPSNLSSSSTNTSTSTPPVPKFISLRPSRSSGSCYLVSGESTSSTAGEPLALSTTTYRFGPGRPPRVRIFSPYSSDPRLCQPASEDTGGQSSFCSAENDDSRAFSSFEIHCSGVFTRAVRFKPPGLLPSSTEDFDTGDEGRITEQFLEWRYASRKERKSYAATSVSKGGEVPDSLLVLSKVVTMSYPTYSDNTAGSSAPNTGRVKTRTTSTPLARFIRSASLRTKGSTVSSAGNGGQLEILDLGEVLGLPEGEKSKREMAVVMIVTTCLVMLKKEVDRRRAQQIAVLSGAGS